jgi:hypothetical protein
MIQKPTKYVVTAIPPHNDKLDHPVTVGETLYKLMKPDYGGSSLDTNLLGTECVSVTRKPNGDYPYITMPLNCMEKQA